MWGELCATGLGKNGWGGLTEAYALARKVSWAVAFYRRYWATSPSPRSSTKSPLLPFSPR